MTFQQRYQYNPKTDLLGKGGFARVYRAFDTILEREVALKIFNSGISQKYDLVSEIKRAIKLEHPNLCRYYDVTLIESVSMFGEEEKHQIGVMEYLDGGNLKTYLQHSPTALNKLLTDVLKGLGFLHKKGIIHRDLKPQNILVTNTGDGPVAKIIDFGISKESGEGKATSSMLMGTVEYMAPEQFNPAKFGIDGKIGTNIDLWSFGVILYELLEKKHLFRSSEVNNSTGQVFFNILDEVSLKKKLDHLQEPYKEIAKLCLIQQAGERCGNSNQLLKILNENQDAGLTPSPGGQAFSDLALTSPVDMEKKTQVLPPPAAVIIPVMNAETTNWVFVDDKGNRVGSYYYDWADTMYEGMARVNYGKKFGFVNSKGDLVVPCKYDFANRFSEGLAVVNSYVYKGYINKFGEELIPCKYLYADNFSEGLAAVRLIDYGSKYGFIDKNGLVVILFKYDSAEAFVNGIAKVELNNKYGFVDTKGKDVIPIIYDEVNEFKNGIAVVRLNNKYGWIDADNNEVIPIIYDELGDNATGPIVACFNGKCGYLNNKGEKIIPFIYDFADSFSEGIAVVGKEDKYGCIQMDNLLNIYHESIALKYEAMNYFKDGLIAAQLNGKYGFLDQNGKVIITFKYDHARFFTYGLAAVMSMNKWGYIDYLDRQIIPFKYEDVSYFRLKNLIAVKIDGSWRLIDGTGKIIGNTKYEYEPYLEDDLLLVRLNGKYCYIDHTGKIVSE